MKVGGTSSIDVGDTGFSSEIFGYGHGDVMGSAAPGLVSLSSSSCGSP